MDMIIQGIIAAATIIYLFTYLNIRRVLYFALPLDIMVTTAFVVMFAGSYAGMMTGLIAGLIFSLTLRAGRKTLGIEKPKWIRRKGAVLPTLIWYRSRA